VRIADLEEDGDSATYTFDEARAVILQYLDFLAPSGAQKLDAVAAWEAEFRRPYPYPRIERPTAQRHRPQATVHSG